MEPLDQQKVQSNSELPSYRTAYTAILLLQLITLVFVLQHWPFATLMKYSFSALALGFGIHRIVFFRLTLAQKGLLAVILVYPSLYLVVIAERLIQTQELYSGLYLFLGISIISFILFSLYTGIIRRKQIQ
jgi:hypothetical protein